MSQVLNLVQFFITYRDSLAKVPIFYRMLLSLQWIDLHDLLKRTVYQNSIEITFSPNLAQIPYRKAH
jgi:hypothetical protein